MASKIMDRERRLIYLIAIILITASFLCYLPLRHNAFVTYDDYDYIVNNTQIHSGLNIDNIRWALTTSYFSYWHPITWISHMADIDLFGLNPKGHHLMNLFIHMANTVLLFLCLRLMAGKVWESAFVAALFALHPMSVDSVAWAAERKNVLSTLFWFLAIIFYVCYARFPALWRYLLVLLAYVLGLMSKPMLVTLPFLLLLLDYWPLGRYRPGRYVGLVLEKIPLIFLTALSLLMTTLPRWRLGKVIPAESLSVWPWLSRAINSYTGYLINMVSPTRLTVLYPFIWGWPWWETALSAAFLVSITVAAVTVRNKYPYLFVGWFWYLGTLVPVIQVFLVNISPMADRFTYVPFVGIFIIIAWGMRDVLNKLTVYLAATLLITTVLSVFTWIQIGYWRDSGTLYKHAIDVTRQNYMAHNNYGVYLMESGKLDEAMAQFDKGLQIFAYNDELNFNMGSVLLRMGKPREAERYLLTSANLWHKGDRAEFYNRLASSLMAEGKYAEALDYITKLSLIRPKDPDVFYKKAQILIALRMPAEAAGALRETLALAPGHKGATEALRTIAR
ncbi:MAG: tetratricopeptide repeat protein [Nitrospirae bacterium]|nr:tetratricopeptide repeat protein [Nitrospirota bacterium]